MGNVIDVTDATFDAEVLQSEIPVLIDFWGPNCAPCVAIAPHVAALAEELAGRLKVVKMNVHDNMSLPCPTRSWPCPPSWCSRAGRRSAGRRARREA